MTSLKSEINVLFAQTKQNKNKKNISELKGFSNIFIFFRYGLGGCKTAFQETLNQFLSVKKLIAHFDIQTSGAMFDDDNKCYPEKISLVSQYVPISSDSAENMKKQKSKYLQKQLFI